ncbi:MAG: low molecular weight protein tyrosine phosphatase family protein [Pseudooceanicola sp.]
MTNVLFICGKARRRSPTAAALAARLYGVETEAAGLSRDADEVLTPDHLHWADIIAVMEKRQLARLRRTYRARLGRKRLVCLDVPDRYAAGQPELVDLLTNRLRRVFTG